ncbi:glucan endo-1,3-beta-D-glucosidase-like [Cicer arietinum]|uniref:glucan endo-1,3-beta-D-glucosidase n=1 Tax=Cicer arietinum TaxID=3827 RepID=A0A1S2XHN6_CICAR|nr:probable endo-1,3(4)-beta-glucanase ARB_01444 [Cicer arietinum]
MSSSSVPFLFPQTHSTILPNPSNFFSPNLLSTPLPTNSFFQNFVLQNGDQPEYIHPYLIKSSNSSLSFSYPLLLFTTSFLYQVFVPDLTISSSQKTTSKNKHVISSYSHLSVTLEIPSSNLRFFLVRGSPFITANVTKPTSLSITTLNKIVSFSSFDYKKTKHTLQLNNTQKWIIYTSSPINFNHDGFEVISNPFSGIIRIAIVPNSNPFYEKTLDKFSSSYPVSGDANIKKNFSLVYNFQKKRLGDLLMLAHPLHVKLLSNDVKVLHDFKYKSVDGDLVGVVGDSWLLKNDPVSVNWYSNKGVAKESHNEIVSALIKDVNELNLSSISTTSSYFYGKIVGRAARFALIAEEVSYLKVIPKIKFFLKETIEPWLNGNFKGNGFLYEKKWGGLVTQQGLNDSSADFGFGVYNDHHYHLGYFLYGISVLVKIDPLWGQKYKPQVYSLLKDFMNLGERDNKNYPSLRCFDHYKLHSWASGLTEFENGRNQESSSEAVNAYYSAALIGLAYGDSKIVEIGSTILAFEIKAAQTWWHVKLENNLYGEDFAKENRIVGILWANKRDSKLWWAPSECRECRLSIQVLPLLPISETLFFDGVYAKELVEWTLPSLKNKTNVEGWKGFTYALEGIYDKEIALKNIRGLKGFDDGNSFTNLLWWIHSR